MFGKVSRAKDYACIEVEGSRDLHKINLLKELDYMHLLFLVIHM